ncbi:hypothetical protein OJ998_37605 [Solirubrobacter taibaiensis]|nr:hypothetical protein [Solirubrobacter taibaiensis]
MGTRADGELDVLDGAHIARTDEQVVELTRGADERGVRVRELHARDASAQQCGAEVLGERGRVRRGERDDPRAFEPLRDAHLGDRRHLPT